MVKKVFRPFWSLDVMKTEKWLGEMAYDGYQLEKIDFVTRAFVFEYDERKIIQYRICRHKDRVSANSPSLIKSQWYDVFTKGKWSILANENEASELKIFPSRESILKRNRIIKYSIGILLAYQSFGVLLMLITLYLAFFSDNFSSHFEPGSSISLTAMFLILSTLLYILIRLIQSDKKLRRESGSDIALSKRRLDRKTEKALRREGKLIKKRKLAWMYAPDKIETWLEAKEKQGYNLYRMRRRGNIFYFMKGEPRTIKYFVYYQHLVNYSYFDIHKSSGWEVIFTSKFTYMKYTIWRKEYTDDRPQIYSDKKHRLKHARKQCLLYCMFYIFLIVTAVALIVSTVSISIVSPDRPLFWPTPIIFTLLIIEYGYFTIQSIGYYLRTKKKLDN